jgi:hypothetical protein
MAETPEFVFFRHAWSFKPRQALVYDRRLSDR